MWSVIFASGVTDVFRTKFQASASIYTPKTLFVSHASIILLLLLLLYIINMAITNYI